MRDLLNKALKNQLNDDFAQNKHDLHELYSQFEEQAEDGIRSIQALSKLLFATGLEADYTTEKTVIEPTLLIYSGVLLKNAIAMLDLTLTAKDEISNQLYKQATQGGRKWQN